MHELSIALSLVDLACEAAMHDGGSRVIAVHVRLGSLSGVVPEPLRFAFDLAKLGTAIEGARLQIEEGSTIGWCATCMVEHAIAVGAAPRCPVSQLPLPQLRAGRELEVVSLEVEDADSNR